MKAFIAGIFSSALLFCCFEISAQLTLIQPNSMDSAMKFANSIIDMDPDEAGRQSLYVYNSALNIHDTLRMGQALVVYGNSLQLVSELDSATSVLNTAIKFLKERSQCDYALALSSLANVKRKQGLYDKSITLLVKSSGLLYKCRQYEHLLNNIYLIALSYDRKAEYYKAMIALKTLSVLALAYNDMSYLFRSYNYAFILFIKNGKNPEPLISKMTEVIQKCEDPSIKLSAWNNVANYYSKIKNDSAAEYCYLEAFRLAKKVGNPQSTAIISMSLCAFYNKTNGWEKAEHYFLEARKRLQFISEDNWLGLYYFLESKYFINRKEFIQAQSAVDKSMKIIEKHNNYPLLSEMYLQSSRFFTSQGDYFKAHYYLKKHLDVLSILKGKQSDKEMNSLYYNVLMDLEEEKAKSIRLNNENLEKERNIFFLIIIVFVSLFLISSMLLYFFSNRFKQRIIRFEQQRENLLAIRLSLSNELSERNKEIAAAVLNQAMHNEQSTEIIQKLKLIGNKCPKIIQKELYELAGMLGSSLNKNIWNEFEKYFIELNPGFFNVISSKHENLSSRDLRYCALISLQLSSKELALITGMTLQSIHVMRSRLRQKLGLDKDDDLSVYLTGFSHNTE